MAAGRRRRLPPLSVIADTLRQRQDTLGTQYVQRALEMRPSLARLRRVDGAIRKQLPAARESIRNQTRAAVLKSKLVKLDESKTAKEAAYRLVEAKLGRAAEVLRDRADRAAYETEKARDAYQRAMDVLEQRVLDARKKEEGIKQLAVEAEKFRLALEQQKQVADYKLQRNVERKALVEAAIRKRRTEVSAMDEKARARHEAQNTRFDAAEDVLTRAMAIATEVARRTMPAVEAVKTLATFRRERVNEIQDAQLKQLTNKIIAVKTAKGQRAVELQERRLGKLVHELTQKARQQKNKHNKVTKPVLLKASSLTRRLGPKESPWAFITGAAGASGKDTEIKVHRMA